ncbi:MAG: hypothetical protein SF028_05030 [Candidatus Sumerlaeia bacterium]|nr:hypothetical protein [Candidatus Sumerlaeia bacterium]
MSPDKHSAAVPAPGAAPNGAPTSEAVGVCLIDGSTLACGAVERDGARIAVAGARVLELNHLVETTTRYRHPIFMDSDELTYTDPEGIAEGFRRLRDLERLRRPVLGIMPSELVTEVRTFGADNKKARNQRRLELLRRTHSANPHLFPRAVMLAERPLPDGRSITSLLYLRLDDLRVVGSQYEAASGGDFLGLVTSQRAARALLPTLPGVEEDRMTMLLDVGKCRTLFTVRDSRGRIYHDSIPVGLARDDMHYFSAITPSVEELSRVNDRIGSLLFPPEVTPSPLFLVRKSTAQIDCTRFALQIARFAKRALERATTRDEGNATKPPVLYFLGRSSRLPGLQQYLRSWVDHAFIRLDEAPPLGVDPVHGSTWGVVGDAVGVLGGGLAYHARAEDSFGLLLRDMDTAALSDDELDVKDLVEGTLYVFPRPLAKVR